MDLNVEICDFQLVGRAGFEPTKASPIDLQSTPFGHSGISPSLNILMNE
jgi:hypothetical protein